MTLHLVRLHDVLLSFGAGRTQCCTPAAPPLLFEGGDAPGCRLIDGPTQDLNLMVRAGAGAGTLQRATHPLAPGTVRAVYCADAAALHRGDAPADPLPAGSLAWSADPGDQAAWHIAADDIAAGARCWWLAFSAAPAPGGGAARAVGGPSP